MFNAFPLGASVSADLKISWHPGMGQSLEPPSTGPLSTEYTSTLFWEAGHYTGKTFLRRLALFDYLRSTAQRGRECHGTKDSAATVRNRFGQGNQVGIAPSRSNPPCIEIGFRSPRYAIWAGNGIRLQTCVRATASIYSMQTMFPSHAFSNHFPFSNCSTDHRGSACLRFPSTP